MAYRAPPDHLAGFKGPTSTGGRGGRGHVRGMRGKGTEGEERGWVEGKERREKKVMGKVGKNPLPFKMSAYGPDAV